MPPELVDQLVPHYDSAVSWYEHVGCAPYNKTTGIPCQTSFEDSYLSSQRFSRTPVIATKMSSEWDKERKFEIEKVHPMYLITALCVVPFGVYFLLNFLSPLIHRITAMTISEVGLCE
jgi:hypothetical protein